MLVNDIKRNSISFTLLGMTQSAVAPINLALEDLKAKITKLELELTEAYDLINELEFEVDSVSVIFQLIQNHH